MDEGGTKETETYQLHAQSPIGRNGNAVLAGHCDNAASIILEDGLKKTINQFSLSERASMVARQRGEQRNFRKIDGNARAMEPAIWADEPF